MRFQENNELFQLIDSAKNQLKLRLPFVLYRKPGEKTVIGIFQHSDEVNPVSDYSERGFVMAPFDKNGAPVILAPDEKRVVDFQDQIETHSKSVDIIEYGRQDHIELVRKAISAITKKELEKVVVSRSFNIETKKGCFEIFLDALNHYDNSLCYLWYHPKIGMWLGATPELFLKVNGHLIETVSLAGTIKAMNDKKPAWGTKESKEQQVVTDYIEKCFSKNLQKVFVSKPSTVKAGDLWHLKSTILGYAGSNFSIGDVIEDLHPTPAVCGLPRSRALEFIQENEGHQRSFYTGFMGELNQGPNSETTLFVNLRCMKLEEKMVTIFVGGGITEDSNPESEWLETQFKSQTMLTLL